MKRILLLSLLLLPIVALAQYPTFSNKQKLGVQTTGDGLIFRGGIHPNYYIPSNINNAYFYLDTTTSKLYLYSVGTWQQIYPTASDTISLGAYLLKSDTSAMLLPYLKKSDTISLSNRINNKLSLADTASMLLPYLKLADTTLMLTPYFRDSDTTMLNLITRFNSKLNTTDTVSLSNRINLKLNNTDTINLSNRIDIKLNASDTVSLSNRINKKLDTLYINYPTYIDTITNKDTIQIAPSLVLTEGFGINVIGDSINIDSAVILATQQKQIAYVKNQSEVTIYKGQAVYSSGSSGNNKLVTLASSATEQSSSKTFGVVESDSIPNGGHGYIITFGLLSGINTDALNEGSSVYLSSTSGQLTSVKPIAPLHLVTIGVCIRKQQNNGSIFVKIQNGFEFDELHDVRLTDLVDKSSIYYNLSEKLWKDTTAALLVSDTASMLSKYVNTYSNQTGINGDKTFNNVVTIDSATITGKLLVSTNISDAVKISSNTNSTNLELMNSSGTVSIKSSNKNMILQTDTTALVYLNGNNKKVGILTMNPQQELEIAGNVRIDSLNNNIVPTRIVGSDNNGDLTNVNLGEGLSFINDTLKVDLTIIDTAIAASSITLAGHVTGTGSTNSTVNTTISNGVVTNDMLAGGISDSKLNTITTAGKVDNSATTATAAYPYLSQANTIVLRNNDGDFGARNITATNFYGLASTATLANTIQSSNTTGIIKLTTSSNSVLPIITVPDVNATMATTNLSQTFGGTQTFSNTISGSINGNAATVTSVLPSNFASQTANTVLAAPNGSSGTPTFRSLVSSDIPSLNYLPLSGGVLSGGLTGTTGTFTGLNVNNTNVNGEGILTLKSYNFNFANKIQFGDGAVIRREIIYPNSSSNMQFRSYTVGGSSGGYEFYVSNGSTESLAATIGTDKSLSLTGATNISNTLSATTGTFTGLNINNTTTQGILSLQGADNNTPTRIDFKTGNEIRRQIILPTSDSNLEFRTSTIGGTQGGYSFYTRRNPNPSEFLAFNIDVDGNSNFYGTLGVSSNITANSFIKSGGLSTQFLKANGSVDANTYLTTSLAASTYLPLTGGTISGSILNSWTSAYSSAPRNDGAVRRTVTQNLYSANGGTTDRVTHYYTFSSDECCASSPVTMYYGRFNGFYDQSNIIYDASIYYHKNNQFYYRAFSEPENKVTFSIKPSTTVNSISGTKADLYLSGDAQIDRSLNIGTTLGVTGATTLSNLSGTGTRMVVANNTGVLSTQAIPTGTLGGSGTTNYIPKFTGTSTIGNSSIFNNNIGVGINTIDPQYNLDVNGNFHVVGGSLFENTLNVKEDALFYKDVTVNRDLIMNTSQSFSGNGILTDYLKHTGIKFYDSALGNMTIFNKSPSSSFGSIIFSTGNTTGNASGLPTERMRISYEGNVTINKNFTVSGVSNFSSEINAGFNITGTNVRFSSYPAGTLSVNGSGVVTSSSDSTLKIADGLIDSALVKINKLTPRYYYWKDNETSNRQLGFFAQEVNSILGEEAAPTPTNGNKYGIYDISIVAYLVKAVQEQQVIIDTLKSEIDKIKEDIVKLKQN